MDYGFPPELIEFRDRVRAFIGQHRTPELIAEQDDNMRRGYGPWTRAFFQTMAEEGLTSIAWPKEYGGQERGALYLWILTEELSYYGMPFDTLTFNSIGPTIMHFGTDAQKREWLPKIQRYEMNFALGYTEPNAGSDLASLQTRAVRDGDDWVINGQKIYTVRRPPIIACLSCGAYRPERPETPRNIDVRDPAQLTGYHRATTLDDEHSPHQ